MASATPRASVRDHSTATPEARGVRGLRCPAAWPHVADAVIKAPHPAGDSLSGGGQIERLSSGLGALSVSTSVRQQKTPESSYKTRNPFHSPRSGHNRD